MTITADYSGEQQLQPQHDIGTVHGSAAGGRNRIIVFDRER
jgi:hypothetical protein